MTVSVPIVITSAGYVPQSPTVLNAELIAEATALQPGLTANLPGALIEDLAGTGTGALLVTDAALAANINSISPTNSSENILIQQGQLYGVPQGLAVNGQVSVVFSTSPATAGFAVNRGFLVSDGTNQYTVQDGGVTNAAGVTPALFCLAVQSGTFSIGANTVTQLVTSVPSIGFTLTCTNPTAGIPAQAAQTVAQYRGDVIQGGLAAAQGMPTFLKTLARNVTGVSSRLVAATPQGSNWVISVGGGDPYSVAYAIFLGIDNPAILAGSELPVTNITNANPGVVTTEIAHGFTGTVSGVVINGVLGMTGINGVSLTITVVDAYHFRTGTDTTAAGGYMGGGDVTPNLRNQVVTIQDYPDSYDIPFVAPLQQTVNVILTWNTTGTSFVSSAAVSALAVPAITAYIDSVPTGQALNQFALQNAFEVAIASILPVDLISKMQFVVVINGIGVAPTPGTGLIPGDAFSYFQAGTITVSQG